MNAMVWRDRCDAPRWPRPKKAGFFGKAGLLEDSHGRRTRRAHRGGATVPEAIVGMVIAIAVLAAVAQLLALASQQRRVAAQRAAAVRAAGNLMEDLMSRPWADVTAEELAAVALSESCQHNLPGGRLQVAVASEDESTAKRIGIRIDWQNPSGQRGEPVRLTAWRYPDQEAKP
jgi:hypothetical protein